MFSCTYRWKASSHIAYNATTLSLKVVEVIASRFSIGILCWGVELWESFLLVTHKSAKKLWISTLMLNKSDLRPVKLTIEDWNHKKNYVISILFCMKLLVLGHWYFEKCLIFKFLQNQIWIIHFYFLSLNLKERSRQFVIIMHMRYDVNVMFTTWEYFISHR